MSDLNKHNLVYFEHESMRGLYELMDEWQLANEKRLLSTSIHQDSGKFCCIALTNPMEVTIVAPWGSPITVFTDTYGGGGENYRLGVQT